MSLRFRTLAIFGSTFFALVVIPFSVQAQNQGLQTGMSLLQIGIGGLQLQAALGGGNGQNAACNPVDVRCPCNVVWKCDSKGCGCKASGSNMHMCPVGSCQNNTSGFVTLGQCTARNFCTGRTSGGGSGSLGGGQQGLAGGLQGLSSILQGLQGLMGQGGGGSGAGGYPQGYAGCTQYYYTATTTSDPCAIYQPNLVSDSLGNVIQPGISDQLLGALGGTGTNISDILDTNTNTNTNTNISSILNGTQAPQNTLAGASQGQLQNSLTGDVRLGGAGATVFANLKQGLTEVAGFFGGSTFGGSGSQSALARLCSARPWAGNSFVASVTPDSFFDGLCRRAGYEPGQPLQVGGGGAPTPNTSFTVGQQQIPAASTTTTPYIPPEADIRAEPASVRLGTRTYIFWNSRGVSSCAVTGPSFTQNTPAGAGATVPITGPTTFTIVCAVTNASTTVSDSVTVNLAI